MAGIGNSLYPPIFNQSYMPAFVNNCRVYFTLSNFNSIQEIKQDAVQVTVRSQKTNKTVLSTSLYPSEIKLANLQVDNERIGDKYYITINNSDIQGGFNYNEYYKVQIRFTSINASNRPSSNKIDSWLNTNLGSFSEWSTVVLIRPISIPTLELNNFSSEADSTTLNVQDLTIVGKVTFDVKDSETLKSYYIHIYDINDELLQDSGDIYTSTNEINYRCKYGFETGETYKLGIQILTNNLYSWSEEKKFTFNINFIPYKEFEGTMTASAEDQAGRIQISISHNEPVETVLNVVIRRTSNESNFQIWEDVYITNVPANSLLNIKWYDYTVESGIWYKYAAQQINKQGWRSTLIQTNSPVMINPEDIFLLQGGKQLKIRFDPEINNFSYVLAENLSQTIGSKYPFITRNGNVNYRTFSISGTISAFMDIRQNLMQASKKDLYGDDQSLYNTYNELNNINLYKDTIYEKKFREKVMEFLYQNNVKLFKSSTEGNILVKLMNISFTPNNTLSRHIYSFSCTAYEIDQFTYQNCLKYNIQQKGSIVTDTGINITVPGQLLAPAKNIYWKELGTNYEDRLFSNEQYFGTSNLMSNIRSKYGKWETDVTQIAEDSFLTYLKIELSSPPYLIGINDNGPYRITENGSEAVCLGHIVIINGTTLIINKDGVYELTDDGTRINTLSFPYAREQGTISYEIQMTEEEKSNLIAQDYSAYYKVGQLWNSFSPNESVYQQIFRKYSSSYGSSSSDNNTFVTTLDSILGLRIYAEEGIVFYIKERQDSNLERHVMGSSGVLQFYDDNTKIQGFYFVGPHLIPATNKDYPQDYEYVDTELLYNSFEDIKQPIRNGVYTIIDSSSEPDPSKVDAEDLGITTIELGELMQMAAAAHSQEGIRLNEQFMRWIENNDKFNDKTLKEKNILLDQFYQGVLQQYITSGNKYIYYQGGWYRFTDEADVALGYNIDSNVQVADNSIMAIIDYYCYILRERF